MDKSVENLCARGVSLLRRLIEIPSTSGNEGGVADVVAEALREGGFAPRREGNNAWAEGPQVPGRERVLLNAHLDTVKPVSGWKRDPFTASQEGDRLYGLGSNDCGGGLVCLLQTFLAAASRPVSDQRFNLVFLASCEEEISGRNGIERALPLLGRFDFAVVGEPTGMQPAIAERGLMVVDAVAHGRSGHAARDEGVNAIYAAMRDVALLSDPANGLFPKESALLGRVKTTVTVIHAGTQHNVVPDRCEFVVDVRSNECYTNEEIFHRLEARLESELRARSFRLNPSGIAASHPFVQACEALGLRPFGSPTLSDQALMPFPSLKLGPGDSARSHTADEYVCLSELEGAIRLYLKLLS